MWVLQIRVRQYYLLWGKTAQSLVQTWSSHNHHHSILPSRIDFMWSPDPTGLANFYRSHQCASCFLDWGRQRSKGVIVPSRTMSCSSIAGPQIRFADSLLWKLHFVGCTALFELCASQARTWILGNVSLSLPTSDAETENVSSLAVI